MRLEIKGLAELRARLAQIRPEEIMAQALEAQAESMADAVRDGLSNPPGGDHDKPWARTGALRNSIQSASGLEAAIGSNDPAAAPQEMGTSHLPPRPFFAPVAASMGQEIAQAVAEAMVAALKGEPYKVEPIIVAHGQVGLDLTTKALGVTGSPRVVHRGHRLVTPAAEIRSGGTIQLPFAGPNALDPTGLSDPSGPSVQEQIDITATYNLIMNGQISGRRQHTYANYPSQTGAILPSSTVGYTVYDVVGSDFHGGKGALRLIIENNGQRAFYTNNHYNSFYEIVVK